MYVSICMYICVLQLCLAHKGPVTRVWVRYNYRNTATDTQSAVVTFTPTVPDMTRYVHCVTSIQGVITDTVHLVT